MEITFDQLPEAVCQLNRKIDEIGRVLAQLNGRNEEGGGERPLAFMEASEFFNLKVFTLYSKVSRNEIPEMKRSGRLYCFKTELLKYLAQVKQLTNEEIETNAETFLKGRRDCHA